MPAAVSEEGREEEQKERRNEGGERKFGGDERQEAVFERGECGRPWGSRGELGAGI